MTREQIDAIERLCVERSDSLDASSYSIPELLAAARAAALEEAAGIADSLGKRYDEACKRAGMISIMSSGCFNAAAEIRARIDKEENTPCPPPK